MADSSSPFQFEDVPLDQARMEPMLYDTLRQKIQALSTEATRIHLGPEIRLQRMKNYIHQIARELDVPVTVRRVPGGVIFWRSSEEDVQQAQEAASRLQPSRQQGKTAHMEGLLYTSGEFRRLANAQAVGVHSQANIPRLHLSFRLSDVAPLPASY